MPNATLDLQVRPEFAARQDRHSASFRGFVIERVVVGGDIAYDYQWVGARQYLAIHDIELKDGEISVDGAAPVQVTDLCGSMTFTPRGCGLSGWASTAKRQNSFTSITFDADMVAGELENLRQPMVDSAMVHFRDQQLEAALWKLDAALKDFTPPEALHLETLALTAVLGLNQVSRGQPLRPGESGGLSASSERRIREFIRDRLSANMTLTDMAEVVGLSRFHFSRAFKTTFGLSPRDYVLWSRVEAAKVLLASTRHPIAQIALQVGFEKSRPARSFLQALCVADTARIPARGALIGLMTNVLLPSKYRASCCYRHICAQYGASNTASFAVFKPALTGRRRGSPRRGSGVTCRVSGDVNAQADRGPTPASGPCGASGGACRLHAIAGTGW